MSSAPTHISHGITSRTPDRKTFLNLKTKTQNDEDPVPIVQMHTNSEAKEDDPTSTVGYGWPDDHSIATEEFWVELEAELKSDWF